jgi:hypothetical protein
MKSKKTDVEKKHYWQRMIREATRSKLQTDWVDNFDRCTQPLPN